MPQQASSADLYFKQLQLGPAMNFVYLLGSKATQECLVVDPAWDVPEILSTIKTDGMTLKGAVVTHYHADHCGGHLWGHNIPGLAELKEKSDVPIYANKHELDGLLKVTGLPASAITVKDSGDTINIGEQKVTLMHTPGHTPGSQCLLCSGRLISGDTLFISGCGRTDLPGGNSEQLFHSLSTQIAKLPPETVLFPGHRYDPQDYLALKDVVKVNPYLRAQTYGDFGR